MSNEKDDPKISSALAAVAFGQQAIERADYDLGGITLRGILTAIDSLLGKRDAPEPFPNVGAKGAEFVHQLVQHVVVASVCQFVFAEMGFSTTEGSHRKPAFDAKARAELRFSRAVVAGALDKYEFEPDEEPVREIPATPRPGDEEREKKARDEAAAAAAKSGPASIGSAGTLTAPKIDSKSDDSKAAKA